MRGLGGEASPLDLSPACHSYYGRLKGCQHCQFSEFVFVDLCPSSWKEVGNIVADIHSQGNTIFSLTVQ